MTSHMWEKWDESIQHRMACELLLHGAARARLVAEGLELPSHHNTDEYQPPTKAESSTDTPEAETNYDYPDHGPKCCVDECEHNVPGLKHGYEPASRDGVVCNDCWDFLDTHGHWPDETDNGCPICRVTT